MAFYTEGKGAVSDVEPVGLVTEGAAGIAVIVLAIIALSGTSTVTFAAIVTIIIGVGLMVQAFNSAAEVSKALTPANAHAADLGGEVLVDCACGITGIVLGILALVGIRPEYLVPAALIVFGGALLLSGAIAARPRAVGTVTGSTETPVVTYRGSAATSGMEVLVGIAAIVLGILSLVYLTSWVLVLVGFIAVGAAMLMVSATFSGAVLRLFATP